MITDRQRHANTPARNATESEEGQLIEIQRTLALTPASRVSKSMYQHTDCDKNISRPSVRAAQGQSMQIVHLGQVHERFDLIVREQRVRQTKQRQKNRIRRPGWQRVHSDGCCAVHVVRNERIGERMNQARGKQKRKVKNGDNARVEIRHCGEGSNQNATGFHACTTRNLEWKQFFPHQCKKTIIITMIYNTDWPGAHSPIAAA